MINAFFTAIEKIEIVITLTICVAFVIYLVIGYPG